MTAPVILHKCSDSITTRPCSLPGHIYFWRIAESAPGIWAVQFPLCGKPPSRCWRARSRHYFIPANRKYVMTTVSYLLWESTTTIIHCHSMIQNTLHCIACCPTMMRAKCDESLWNHLIPYEMIQLWCPNNTTQSLLMSFRTQSIRVHMPCAQWGTPCTLMIKRYSLFGNFRKRFELNGQHVHSNLL